MNEEKITEEVVQNTTTNTPITIKSDEENVALGIVGALLGSLAGAVMIVLFDRLGFVASVAGVAMAACTLTLYEKFAKKISKKGVIICIVVMLIMTLLAENAAYSIQVAKEMKEYGYDVSVFKVFTNFFNLLSSGALETGTYIASLVMVYLFTALGAFSIVKQKLKDTSNNKKTNFETTNNQ